MARLNKKKIRKIHSYVFIGILLILLVVIGIFLITKDSNKQEEDDDVKIEEINNWLDYLLSQDIESIYITKTTDGAEKRYELTKKELQKLFESTANVDIKRTYACDLKEVDTTKPSVTVIYKNAEGNEFIFNNLEWISTMEPNERITFKTHYMQDRLFLEAIDMHIENPTGENTCDAKELVYFTNTDYLYSEIFNELTK